MRTGVAQTSSAVLDLRSLAVFLLQFQVEHWWGGGVVLKRLSFLRCLQSVFQHRQWRAEKEVWADTGLTCMLCGTTGWDPVATLYLGTSGAMWYKLEFSLDCSEKNRWWFTSYCPRQLYNRDWERKYFCHSGTANVPLSFTKEHLMLQMKWQLPIAHAERQCVNCGHRSGPETFLEASSDSPGEKQSSSGKCGLKGDQIRRNKEKTEGEQLKKKHDSHSLAFTKVLPLEFLIALKINMTFKVTHVPSDPVYHISDWGSERINKCPQKG